MREASGRLDRGDGVTLAWRRVPGRAPGVVFLGGFNSDMTGTKAVALAAWCAAREVAFLRFDYSGHGESGGRFEDGTIGGWTREAARVLAKLTEGPQILAGSSMGGWIATLLTRQLPDRVAGLVGIAAAPDFTTRIEASLPVDARIALERDGVWLRPSAYGAPYPITRALLEDGAGHLVLDGPLAITAPVRLLHGQRDADVPWEDALRLAKVIEGRDVTVTLVKDGEHRLSRPQDLRLLERKLEELLEG